MGMGLVEFWLSKGEGDVFVSYHVAYLFPHHHYKQNNKTENAEQC